MKKLLPSKKKKEKACYTTGKSCPKDKPIPQTIVNFDASKTDRWVAPRAPYNLASSQRRSCRELVHRKELIVQKGERAEKVGDISEAEEG